MQQRAADIKKQMDYSNYVFFYGHTKPKGFFSNFYPAHFEYLGLSYNCSEQYFMKKKQELFDPLNKELADKIMAEKSPAKIKKYGRQVKNYDDSEWEKVRFKHMLNATLLKFSQDHELSAELLATGEKIIVEASLKDKIWGIGLSEKKAKETNPKKWPGRNLLGKALMKARGKIQKILLSAKNNTKK